MPLSLDSRRNICFRPRPMLWLTSYSQHQENELLTLSIFRVSPPQQKLQGLQVLIIFTAAVTFLVHELLKASDSSNVLTPLLTELNHQKHTAKMLWECPNCKRNEKHGAVSLFSACISDWPKKRTWQSWGKHFLRAQKARGQDQRWFESKTQFQ